ncbi:hypothetical protein H8356DRAFT_1338836 [Neocallimastix lanati (nom. inval.)]|nr:hypothetical protein H8356DRAFT_1338836 [Neocallimastix sp. JGI-2020a]
MAINKNKLTNLRTGTIILNPVNHQQIEIMIENLYHYLLSIKIPQLLTKINNHYGYLPLKPFVHDHRRVNRQELNEPKFTLIYQIDYEFFFQLRPHFMTFIIRNTNCIWSNIVYKALNFYPICNMSLFSPPNHNWWNNLVYGSCCISYLKLELFQRFYLSWLFTSAMPFALQPSLSIIRSQSMWKEIINSRRYNYFNITSPNYILEIDELFYYFFDLMIGGVKFIIYTGFTSLEYLLKLCNINFELSISCVLICFFINLLLAFSYIFVEFKVLIIFGVFIFCINKVNNYVFEFRDNKNVNSSKLENDVEFGDLLQSHYQGTFSDLQMLEYAVYFPEPSKEVDVSKLKKTIYCESITGNWLQRRLVRHFFGVRPGYCNTERKLLVEIVKEEEILLNSTGTICLYTQAPSCKEENKDNHYLVKEVLFSSIVSFGGEKLKLGCLKQEKGTEGINIPMTKIDLDDDFFDNNKMPTINFIKLYNKDDQLVHRLYLKKKRRTENKSPRHLFQTQNIWLLNA